MSRASAATERAFKASYVPTSYAETPPFAGPTLHGTGSSAVRMSAFISAKPSRTGAWTLEPSVSPSVMRPLSPAGLSSVGGTLGTRGVGGPGLKEGNGAVDTKSGSGPTAPPVTAPGNPSDGGLNSDQPRGL